MIVGQNWRYPPKMTHDYGPGRSPRAVGRLPRRWAGALRGVSRAAQCNGRESIDCRLRPWLSPLVPGIINCPRKKKIQQSLSESNAFVCARPLARSGARPRQVRRIRAATGRRRGGGGRTRSHTAAATLARRPRLEPYAAAMAIWADILTGARRPGETGGRAALAVSDAGSPCRPASPAARQGREWPMLGGRPRRSGNPAVTDTVPAWLAGRSAARGLDPGYRRPRCGPADRRASHRLPCITGTTDISRLPV